MSSKQSYVLDSWPILEWMIGNQPAARHFSEFLEKAIGDDSSLLISRMNYGEVLYMMPRKLPLEKLEPSRKALRYLPLQIISVDDSYVDQAVLIKTENACSFADCFAASVAIRFSAPVVTGDPEFLKLQSKGLLTVEWLGA